MRAAYAEQLGPPDVIRYGQLAAPVPGPDEVLVDVRATTVNPVDTFVRSGVFRTPLEFPFVIGRDLVGTVASPGGGFAVGDAVWCNSLGHGGRQGAAAEQAVVPVDRLYRLPPGVAPEIAVAVVHPAATAYLALFTHGGLCPGETVLVAGAAGNVGAALVVLAVRAGARVIATAAARDHDYCRSLGAAEIVDYRDLDLTRRLAELAPAGVDVHVDTSGRNDLTSAVALLAHRGRIVLLAGAKDEPVLPVGPLYMKDASVRGFAISHATPSELASAATTINDLLSRGLLHPRAMEPLPLSTAADVHHRMERGELHGKRIVLHTNS
ncbi:MULTISPECIES: NADPH:quinone reductase [unclassified Streptomyces]|uniref:NADPH:quinone reductase n=1 Tax=unclassified Streptomyces TaxID=2593676 RepID=UPI002E7FB71A|nr:NADPH:quinone reductase [Streptomyces sp. NBC_00589]WTI35192.1 NADPH:quinone reductase [Streptomyces sp. NBC_00775]WUB31134.1 NADPH:quinone reductase [Streptomyces sp. NBC_00589]